MTNYHHTTQLTAVNPPLFVTVNAVMSLNNWHAGRSNCLVQLKNRIKIKISSEFVAIPLDTSILDVTSPNSTKYLEMSALPGVGYRETFTVSTRPSMMMLSVRS